MDNTVDMEIKQRTTVESPTKALLQHHDPTTKVCIHGLKYVVNESTKQACFYVEDIEETSETFGKNAKKFLWQSQKWIVTLYDERLFPPYKKKPVHRRTFKRKRKEEGMKFEVTETITLDVEENHNGTTHLREYIWNPKVVNTEESFILVTYTDTEKTMENTEVIPPKLSTSYVGNTSHIDFEMTFDEENEFMEEFEFERPSGALARLTYVSEKLAQIRKLERVTEEQNDDNEEEEKCYEIEPINIKMTHEPAMIWVEPYEGRYGLSTSHFQLSERFGASCESRLLRVTTRAGYLSDFSQSFSEARKIKRYRSKSELKQPQYEDLPDDVIVIDKLDQRKRNKIEEDGQGTSDDEGFEEIELEFPRSSSAKSNANLNNGTIAATGPLSHQENPKNTNRVRDNSEISELEVPSSSEKDEVANITISVPSNFKMDSGDKNPPKPTLESVAMKFNSTPQSNDTADEKLTPPAVSEQKKKHLDLLSQKSEPLPGELSNFQQYQCKGIMMRNVVTKILEVNDEDILEKPVKKQNVEIITTSKEDINKTTLFAITPNLYKEENDNVRNPCLAPELYNRGLATEDSIDVYSTRKQAEEINFDLLLREDEIDETFSNPHCDDLQAFISTQIVQEIPKTVFCDDEVTHDKSARLHTPREKSSTPPPSLTSLKLSSVIMNTQSGEECTIVSLQPINRDIVEEDIILDEEMEKDKSIEHDQIKSLLMIDSSSENLESSIESDDEMDKFQKILSSDKEKDEINNLQEEVVFEKKKARGCGGFTKPTEPYTGILPSSIVPVFATAAPPSVVTITNVPPVADQPKRVIDKETIIEHDIIEKDSKQGEEINDAFQNFFIQDSCTDVTSDGDLSSCDDNHELDSLRPTVVPCESYVKKFHVDEEIVNDKKERPRREIVKQLYPDKKILPVQLAPITKTTPLKKSTITTPSVHIDIVVENDILEDEMKMDEQIGHNFFPYDDEEDFVDNHKQSNNASLPHNNNKQNACGSDLITIDSRDNIAEEKVLPVKKAVKQFEPYLESVPSRPRIIQKESSERDVSVHEVMKEESDPNDQDYVTENHEEVPYEDDIISDSDNELNDLRVFKESLPNESKNSINMVEIEEELVHDIIDVPRKEVKKSYHRQPVSSLQITPVVTNVSSKPVPADRPKVCKDIVAEQEIHKQESQNDENCNRDFEGNFDVDDDDVENEKTRMLGHDLSDDKGGFNEGGSSGVNAIDEYNVRGRASFERGADKCSEVSTEREISSVTSEAYLSKTKMSVVSDNKDVSNVSAVTAVPTKASIEKRAVPLKLTNKDDIEEVGVEYRRKSKSLKSRAKNMISKSFKNGSSGSKENSFEDSFDEEFSEKTKKKKKTKSKFSFKSKQDCDEKLETREDSPDDPTEETREKVSRKKVKSKFYLKTKQNSLDGASSKKKSFFSMSKKNKNISDTVGKEESKKMKYNRSETQPVVINRTKKKLPACDVNGDIPSTKVKYTRSQSYDSLLVPDTNVTAHNRELNERRRRLAGYSYVNSTEIPNEVVKGREYTIEACARETEKEINRVRDFRRKSRSNSSSKKSMSVSIDILDKINTDVGHVKIPDIFLRKNEARINSSSSVGRISIPQAFSVENVNTIGNGTLKRTITQEMLI